MFLFSDLTLKCNIDSFSLSEQGLRSRSLSAMWFAYIRHNAEMKEVPLSHLREDKIHALIDSSFSLFF